MGGGVLLHAEGQRGDFRRLLCGASAAAGLGGDVEVAHGAVARELFIDGIGGSVACAVCGGFGGALFCGSFLLCFRALLCGTFGSRCHSRTPSGQMRSAAVLARHRVF